MSKEEAKKIQDVISNDVCLKKILSADSDSEVKQVFDEAGIALDDNQVKKFKETFIKQIIKLHQIEDEECLSAVDGGKDYKNATLKGGGYGCYYGMWIGAGLGALAGIVDTGFKIKKGQLDTSWDSIKNVLKFSIIASIGSGTASAITGTGASVIYESTKD